MIQIDMFFPPGNFMGRDFYELVFLVPIAEEKDFQAWLDEMCPTHQILQAIRYGGDKPTIVDVCFREANDIMKVKLAYQTTKNCPTLRE